MRIKGLILAVVILTSCAPLTNREGEVAEVDLKLSRLEDAQERLKEDVRRTNERLDKLAKLVADLRLELEKLRLSLSPGDRIRKSPESSEVVRIEPELGMGLSEEEQVKEDAESAYRKAVELYNLKRLYEARDSFISFIKRFPENKYTDNAFFWIAKIYHELGDVSKAEKIYKNLISKCEKGKLPDCNKLPDTYLQLMNIYIERGNMKEANRYYSLLTRKFPSSEAAMRAKRLIQNLR